MQDVSTTLGVLPDVMTAIWNACKGLVSIISSRPLLLISVGIGFASGIVELAKLLLDRETTDKPDVK